MGTTPLLGIPYPEPGDYVTNGAQAIEDATTAVETALTTAQACPGNGLTLAAGWTQVGDVDIHRCGLLVHVRGQVERTGAGIAAGADGNVGNVAVGTIAPNVIPAPGDIVCPAPVTVSALSSGSAGRVAHWVITAAKVVTLTAVSPGATIATGEQLSYNGTFLASDYPV